MNNMLPLHVPGGPLAISPWLQGRFLASVSLWCVLNVVAIVAAARRLDGALDSTLSTLPYLAAILLPIVLGLLAKGLFYSTGLERRVEVSIVTGGLSLLPPILFAAALYPAPSVAVFVLVCLAWILEAVGVLYIERLVGPPSRKEESAADLAKGPLSAFEHLPEVEADERQLSMQMSRGLDAEGRDVLEALLAAHFEPGQKQLSLHIPFCPPFERTPQVDCEAEDESTVRIKVGTVYPYGTRLDLKRTGSTGDAITMHVQVVASAESPVTAAGTVTR